MIFVRTDSFRRDFQNLPPVIQGQVEHALRLLATNPRHPSLRMKKVKPTSRGIFELRVSKGYRLTITKLGDRLLLRRVGPHDILRRP